MVKFLKRYFKLQEIENQIQRFKGSVQYIRSLEIDEGMKAQMILRELRRIEELKLELDKVRNAHLSVD